MKPCENCGDAGCAAASSIAICGQASDFASLTCERHAKEQAHAEIARLRAKLDRVREACKPGEHTPLCAEYSAQKHDGCICSLDSDNELRAEIAAILGEP